MKNFVITLILLAFLGCGAIAFAQETEYVDCDCRKGGLGLKLGNFVCAIGGKTFNSGPGCDTNVGIGLGIGSEDNRLQFGFGYDMGVIGIGFSLKNPETTSIFGFSVGYDYGDCRMVWPYEE
ncbi:MAG: hypothetical protein U9R24_03245 [Thermodesulfobacteriota bacterium]|nr:hypothetical protein [Thermodesulfobacteriota bacterium]